MPDKAPRRKITISMSDWQQTVLDALDQYRFVVVSAGRQSGKTHLGIIALFFNCIKTPSTVAWWCAPTYQNSKVAFRRLVDLCATRFPEIKLRTNKQELRIEFPNGSAIDFKSADREEGLRGESVNFLIVDEMGFIKRDVWQFALRGTITATGGRVLFIGTPKGKNLFYELYQKGQDPEEKEYCSFQFESRRSPYFSDYEWDQVKRLPQRVFEQEYKAHFIDSGGEVFRNIADCIGGQLATRKTGKRYYAGVDLARTVDYTVICILDNDKQLVAFERFNELSWSIQKKRIIDLCKRYDAHTLVDSTGVGDPIYDDLCRAGLGVESFKFSNQSKRQIVESLAMTIDRAEIKFPEIPELINELEIFTFDETSTGLIRYSAPDGMHDDIVMALALANWAAGGQASPDDFSDMGERTTYDW